MIASFTMFWAVSLYTQLNKTFVCIQLPCIRCCSKTFSCCSVSVKISQTWQNSPHDIYNCKAIHKLDESTAHRQLKSPWSLSGRSIHLTLVTKWSRSWSWMTYCLCAMSTCPPILRYTYFKISPWKSMVKVMCVVKGQGHVWPSKFKGYGQGQTHWSHLRPGIQSICLLFVSWQSEHFWLRYRKFYIWPWKFKVKVTAKVKPDGHIWGLGLQSICLLFVSWQLDHFWLRYSKFHIWPWKM